MDGFAFLRRKEKFVASFRSAIHAFLPFQPLRWLKWLLVPGGKERELNIWPMTVGTSVTTVIGSCKSNSSSKRTVAASSLLLKWTCGFVGSTDSTLGIL